MRHPLDPGYLHTAAEGLGRKLAEGIISFESVRGCCRQWAQGQTQVDKSGLQARLVWAAVDTADNRLRAIANAEMSVRWAVRPLLARKAPTHIVEEAAGKAAGPILSWDQITPILSDEWNRAQPRGMAR